MICPGAVDGKNHNTGLGYISIIARSLSLILSSHTHSLFLSSLLLLSCYLSLCFPLSPSLFHFVYTVLFLTEKEETKHKNL